MKKSHRARRNRRQSDFDHQPDRRYSRGWRHPVPYDSFPDSPRRDFLDQYKGSSLCGWKPRGFFEGPISRTPTRPERIDDASHRECFSSPGQDQLQRGLFQDPRDRSPLREENRRPFFQDFSCNEVPSRDRGPEYMHRLWRQLMESSESNGRYGYCSNIRNRKPIDSHFDQHSPREWEQDSFNNWEEDHRQEWRYNDFSDHDRGNWGPINCQSFYERGPDLDWGPANRHQRGNWRQFDIEPFPERGHHRRQGRNNQFGQENTQTNRRLSDNDGHRGDQKHFRNKKSRRKSQKQENQMTRQSTKKDNSPLQRRKRKIPMYELDRKRISTNKPKSLLSIDTSQLLTRDHLLARDAVPPMSTTTEKESNKCPLEQAGDLRDEINESRGSHNPSPEPKDINTLEPCDLRHNIKKIRIEENNVIETGKSAEIVLEVSGKDQVSSTNGKPKSKLVIRTKESLLLKLSTNNHELPKRKVSVCDGRSSSPNLFSGSGRSSPGLLSGGSSPNVCTGRSSPGLRSGRSLPNACTGRSSPGLLSGRSSPNVCTGRSSPKVTCGRSSPNVCTGRSSPGLLYGRSSPNVGTERSSTIVCSDHSSSNCSSSETISCKGHHSPIAVHENSQCDDLRILIMTRRQLNSDASLELSKNIPGNESIAVNEEKIDDESLVELDYSREPILDEKRESSTSSSCSQRIVFKTERHEPFKQNKIGHKKKSTTEAYSNANQNVLQPSKDSKATGNISKEVFVDSNVKISKTENKLVLHSANVVTRKPGNTDPLDKKLIKVDENDEKLSNKVEIISTKEEETLNRLTKSCPKVLEAKGNSTESREICTAQSDKLSPSNDKPFEIIDLTRHQMDEPITVRDDKPLTVIDVDCNQADVPEPDTKLDCNTLEDIVNSTDVSSLAVDKSAHKSLDKVDTNPSLPSESVKKCGTDSTKTFELNFMQDCVDGDENKEHLTELLKTTTNVICTKHFSQINEPTTSMDSSLDNKNGKFIQGIVLVTDQHIKPIGKCDKTDELLSSLDKSSQENIHKESKKKTDGAIKAIDNCNETELPSFPIDNLSENKNSTQVDKMSTTEDTLVTFVPIHDAEDLNDDNSGTKAQSNEATPEEVASNVVDKGPMKAPCESYNPVEYSSKEQLPPHFGKPLENVDRDLNVDEAFSKEVEQSPKVNRSDSKCFVSGNSSQPDESRKGEDETKKMTKFDYTSDIVPDMNTSCTDSAFSSMDSDCRGLENVSSTKLNVKPSMMSDFIPLDIDDEFDELFCDALDMESSENQNSELFDDVRQKGQLDDQLDMESSDYQNSEFFDDVRQKVHLDNQNVETISCLHSTPLNPKNLMTSFECRSSSQIIEYPDDPEIEDRKLELTMTSTGFEKFEIHNTKNEPEQEYHNESAFLPSSTITDKHSVLDLPEKDVASSNEDDICCSATKQAGVSGELAKEIGNSPTLDGISPARDNMSNQENKKRERIKKNSINEDEKCLSASFLLNLLQTMSPVRESLESCSPVESNGTKVDKSQVLSSFGCSEEQADTADYVIYYCSDEESQSISSVTMSSVQMQKYENDFQLQLSESVNCASKDMESNQPESSQPFGNSQASKDDYGDISQQCGTSPDDKLNEKSDVITFGGISNEPDDGFIENSPNEVLNGLKTTMKYLRDDPGEMEDKESYFWEDESETNSKEKNVVENTLEIESNERSIDDDKCELISKENTITNDKGDTDSNETFSHSVCVSDTPLDKQDSTDALLDEGQDLLEKALEESTKTTSSAKTNADMLSDSLVLPVSSLNIENYRSKNESKCIAYNAKSQSKSNLNIYSEDDTSLPSSWRNEQKNSKIDNIIIESKENTTQIGHSEHDSKNCKGQESLCDVVDGQTTGKDNKRSLDDSAAQKTTVDQCKMNILGILQKRLDIEKTYRAECKAVLKKVKALVKQKTKEELELMLQTQLEELGEKYLSKLQLFIKEKADVMTLD